MTIKKSVLQSLPLFASLPADALNLLSDQLRPVQFADGALVVREGEICDEFYIVISGQVDIVKALDTPDQRLLAVRPPGTVVGELSLFNPGGSHTASVLAHGPVEMLSMTSADFDSLLSREPRLAYGMVQTLSLRLIEGEQNTVRDLHAKNAALAQALQALQAAQAQLVEKEKMERELEVARRIQHSLLPKEPPRVPGFDFGALMASMSAVGGDFYDFVEFPDGRLGLAIGDVSDHGVAAALFGSMTMTLLRTAARREADPAAVLRSVNHGLLEFDRSGMFVTVLYGVLDPRRRVFVYARAGHEPPLLHLGPGGTVPSAPRSAEESGMWIVDSSAWATSSKPSAAPTTTDRLGRRGKKSGLLAGGAQRETKDAMRESKDEGRRTNAQPSSSFTQSVQPSSSREASPQPSSFKRGQALGIFAEPELDEQTLLLPARGTLLLYTDGAREAWDHAGNMFGEKGLRALLAENETEPAQTVCERLLQRVVAHCDAAPQQDDITLVAVRA